MTHSIYFDQAVEQLLAPAELSLPQAESMMGALLAKGVDYGDLYFQHSIHESWVLEDGIVKEGSFNIDRGVGVRATSGEKTGFAYSDAIEKLALEQATKTARSIARVGQEGRLAVTHADAPLSLYSQNNPLKTITDAEKIAVLNQIDTTARKLDSRVIQVQASLSGVYETILVMATDGTQQADIRPLVRCNISVIVEQNGKRESGSSGFGGRYSYRELLHGDALNFHINEAVRLALVSLEAEAAPAGLLPVVLGPGWPGVLLHEAVGHGLEGDFNRKGTSAFSGKMGEQVASPLCTIVDDGTLESRRGSLNMDDEGQPTQCTTLIENGILKGYMQDKLNARLMGMASTGNCRRESYAHLPMPRMTNTYMLPGESDPAEIIASVDKGIYAVNFAGGQVDITSGKFVFSTSEAYLIENGKVTRPVKGATLIGSGPECMQKISMVGNDLALDAGVGVCGKDGQSVPVGVGQPTLKIDEITVGGTNI